MPLALVPGRPAERDTVVEGDIIADFGGFADHDAHAVVDEESVSDGGARMDFDAAHEPADLGDEPSGKLEAADPQPVAHPVEHEGVETGIAKNHFQKIAHGGVAPEGCTHVVPEGLEHGAFQPFMSVRGLIPVLQT